MDPPPINKNAENYKTISFKNRDLLCVRNLSVNDIKSLTWTAMNLKKNRRARDSARIKNRIINVIIETPPPSVHTQIAIETAAKSLSAIINVIYRNDFTKTSFDSQLSDFGWYV